MRERTMPCDDRFWSAFPGARSYERTSERITYLAERAGTPCLLLVPIVANDGPPAATVLEFEDERERGAYLAARDRTASAAS